MIAQLTGEIVSLTPLARGGVECVINVHGVGYTMMMPQPTGQPLGIEQGQSAQLATHMHVREGAIELFGFQDAQQKQLFEVLIGVSGVGPKVAIALLSIGSAQALMQALANGDVKYISGAQGVGKKVAQRLVTELSDKVGQWAESSKKGDAGAPQSAQRSSVEQTALVALQQLGFKEREALHALEQVPQKEDYSAQELIRAALRAVAS